MKNMLNAIVFCCLAFTFNALSWSAEKGTADEAIAMVKKAVGVLKASGNEKAFAEFHNPAGAFRDRDLYIFVLNTTGENLANGANPRLAGKNTFDLKDADGKFFVRELIDTAKNKNGGWVDYRWPNPAANTIQHKSAYVEKVGDLIVGCGIYKQ
jgi:cytochrome c